MYDALVKAAGGITAGIGSLLAAPGKVKIPKWVGIDPTKVQGETIKGNQANLPAAQRLAGQVNRFNTEQFSAMLDLALPGLRQQATANTAALLRGELPADVQSSILRSGAARALGMGAGGTGFGRNLTMRDLGLTSLQAQQMGFGQFGTLASMYQPRLMDVSAMFFTPQQRAQIGMWDAEKKWERDLMAAEVAAQPSGTAAAIGNMLMVSGSVMAGSGVPQGFKPSGFTFGSNTGNLGASMPFGGTPYNVGGQWGVARSPANQSAFEAAQSYYEGVNAPSSFGGF